MLNSSVSKIYLFTILFPVFCTHAQHPHFYSINDENDLPSNEVYQTKQDSKGYIWIGCDAGLYRYNGFEFKRYNNQGLNGKSISNLYIDKNQTLWCRNFNGQILKVVVDSLLIVADYNAIGNQFQVLFIENGGYWKIEANKITLHNQSGKEISNVKIKLNGPLIPNGVEMIEYRNEPFIFVPRSGLYTVKNQNKLQLIHAFNQTETNPIPKLFVFKEELYLLNHSEEFLSDSKTSFKTQVYKLDTLSHSLKEVLNFSKAYPLRYFHFFEDTQNKLWIGTSLGAFFIKEISEIENPEMIFFKNHKISSINQDFEGGYWFTDLQKGIHIVPNLEVRKNFNPNISFEYDVNQIHPTPNGKLILGTYDGFIIEFDPITFKHELSKKLNKNNGITVKDIESFNQYLLFSRGHLLIYDTLKGTTFIHPKIVNARDVLVCDDSIICVNPENVTKAAFNCIDTEGCSIKLMDRGGKKLIQDPQDSSIYLALNDGLYHLKNGIYSEIKHKGEKIFAQVFISDGERIWAGTHSSGVLVLSSGKIVNQINFQNKVEDISCKVIHTNGEFVWVFTNTDFIRIEIATNEVIKYSNNIGINPKDANCMTHLKDDLWIGTKKGIIQLPISLSGINKNIPSVYIEKITSEKQYEINQDKIVLPFDFKNLQVEFISFSYLSKKDFYYEYRLIGLDTVWKSTTYNNPIVNFTSLKSGDYTFEVRAINESGIVSQVAQQNITVLSPVWQKTWFLLLLFFAIVILFYSIYRYQIKRIRKKNENEKKLIQSQLIALKAQMNPHFIFNSLNSIQSLILSNDIKASNIYLTKFSQLMRKILETSGEERITLNEEIELLTLYLSLEKLRFGDEFMFEILLDPNIDTYALKIPPLILQPFVENSVKHGLLHKKGNKKLTLSFYLDNQLICVITDNGIGRIQSQKINQKLTNKSKSFSTQSIQKRVELLNAQTNKNLRIEISDLYSDQKDCGTVVKIFIHHEY